MSWQYFANWNIDSTILVYLCHELDINMYILVIQIQYIFSSGWVIMWITSFSCDSNFEYTMSDTWKSCYIKIVYRQMSPIIEINNTQSSPKTIPDIFVEYATSARTYLNSLDMYGINSLGATRSVLIHIKAWGLAGAKLLSLIAGNTFQ